MKSSLLIISLLIYIHSYSQQADSLFFCDAHTHITIKNFMRNYPNPEDFYKNKNKADNNYYNSKYKGGSTDAHFKNFDQATFPQLSKGKFGLAITSITPLERNAVIGKKYNKINFLKSKGLMLSTHLNFATVKGLYNTSSFKSFTTEYEFLVYQVNKNPNSFVIIDNYSQLIDPKNYNKTKIILSAEGGHLLFDEFVDKSYVIKQNPNNKYLTIDTIYKQINKIKNMEHPLFFLTIEHLWWNQIGGQAKALYKPDFISRTFLNLGTNISYINSKIFNKHGSGLKKYSFPLKTKNIYDLKTCSLCDSTIKFRERYDNGTTRKYLDDNRNNPFGIKVVKKLLDFDNIDNKRILIDLRHSDINTRLDYYSIINEYNQNPKNTKKIPIIFSHCAVSGFNLKVSQMRSNRPYFDLQKEITNKNYLNKFYKNGVLRNCALKLDYPSFFYDVCKYDTDLVCTVNNCKKSHIHDIPENSNQWFYPWSINLFDEEIKWVYDSKGILGIMPEERLLGAYQWGYKKSKHLIIKKLKKEYNYSTKEAKVLIETAPFLRNLYYVITHSGRNDASAWDCVVFGSDFDGLTDPLDNCLTSADVPKFYNYLLKNDAKVIKDFCQVYNLDFNKFFPHIKPKDAFDKYFHSNLIEFLKNNFN